MKEIILYTFYRVEVFVKPARFEFSAINKLGNSLDRIPRILAIRFNYFSPTASLLDGNRSFLPEVRYHTLTLPLGFTAVNL